MKISIATISFNSEITTSDTLRSIYLQKHKNIENIVMERGSSGNTLDVIKEKGEHISRVISERDDGIYDAMNKGLSVANGDVVVFLNANAFSELRYS
jgi:glycosyltransferase involved in cell wall biosynthesis